MSQPTGQWGNSQNPQPSPYQQYLPQQTGQYPTQPQNYYQQPNYLPQQQQGLWNPSGVYGGVAEVRKSRKNFLYAIPGIGALLTIAGIFLPWLAFNFFNISISVNAIGSISAPPGFLDGMGKLAQDYTELDPTTSSNVATSTSNNQPFETWHGWLLLGLGVSVIIFIILGMALKSKTLAIGTLVIGLICTGFTLWDGWKTWKLIDDTYKAVTDPIQTTFASIQVGWGLYLAIIGSIAILAGSILTLFLNFKNKTA